MSASLVRDSSNDQSASARRYAHQAERLSYLPQDHQQDERASPTAAVEAKFITPADPVIETADGSRLPAVPLTEAQRLNQLKNETEGAHVAETKMDLEEDSSGRTEMEDGFGASPSSSQTDAFEDDGSSPRVSSDPSAPLRAALPPARTNPLFPPLPLYGPSSMARSIQCVGFRVSSFFLSLGFLGVIVLGSAFTSIPMMFRHIGLRLQFKTPDARRPFHEKEVARRKARKESEKEWTRRRRRRKSRGELGNDTEEDAALREEFEPTEGGHDPIVCDVGYYARRVGLDVEEFNVQTEDGFIITLWHVYNPKEYTPVPEFHKDYRGPHIFDESQDRNGNTYGVETNNKRKDRKPKYPVLLMHGLLQSAGAYCCNDDDSLAFFLCKSGYDVWLGNNRCGFKPRHTLLNYSDPRMWAWNIRQMGVLDLPALISRILNETGSEKLGLICHSQGTTETFVALAKEQRPDLGEKISVFCALAPAVYAGPLIGKAYFKFMRMISPGFFRIIFGIHAFIPFMMTMHSTLPGRLYGALGYRVFSFLFNWTDDRWELDLRDRMFQFAPVYVSAESMRWWLGRECFAKHKCILSTREEGKQEDLEDEAEDFQGPNNDSADRGASAWYDRQAPPFAMWVAGSDDLVDGRRLLRRFERGREPFVNVVHAKVIEEYEHLDVIWAMDMIEKVGKEVRDVIWKTAPESAREKYRVPAGCEKVESWTPGTSS
ncbi:MAG: hypothetical protein M4579_006498 [Chaenotheca gracillima]|nr:MAG: hypothetical protein M4579_006498 [Chaenotheca gracillima]